MKSFVLIFGLLLRESKVQKDAELGNLVTAGAIIALSSTSHKE